LIALFCMLLAPAAADQLSSANSQIVQYIQVLFGLGGVLALAYVTLRFGLPRFFGMRLPTRGPIQLVTRYPLEPKASLYLVQVGSQMFLVGTSQNQISYLTAVAPENAAEILESASKAEVPRKDFRQFLGLSQKRGEN
jgi:flagellar biogenesis protein FliO